MHSTNCLSTHGASGYAPGSYKDGDAVICGACGTRIENPRPTHYRYEYYSFLEAMLSLRAFQKWWRGEPKNKVPLWTT